MTETIKRATALLIGLDRYFTGKPCPAGHRAERFTQGRHCVECVKTRNKTKYEKEKSTLGFAIQAKARNARRRARKRGTEGSYGRKDVYELLHEQKGICVYCGEFMLKFHVDHKTPLCKGGTNAPGNLQLLCGLCNRKKHTDDHGAYLLKVVNALIG